jgi:hypothetical protein
VSLNIQIRVIINRIKKSCLKALGTNNFLMARQLARYRIWLMDLQFFSIGQYLIYLGILVDLRPVTLIGSRRMYLDPVRSRHWLVSVSVPS